MVRRRMEKRGWGTGYEREDKMVDVPDVKISWLRIIFNVTANLSKASFFKLLIFS